MKLIEAVQIVNAEAPSGATPYVAGLCCGFTPLHLKTFVEARCRLAFPERTVQVKTGLYGDLAGTVEQIGTNVDCVLIVVEWPDLDARLGLRTTGNWEAASLNQILADAQVQLLRLDSAVEALASRRIPVVISPPTLPLPPVFVSRPSEASPLELELRKLWSDAAVRWAKLSPVSLVNPAELDRSSPPASRHDIRSELTSGFPYQIAHADQVAQSLLELAVPRVPKKGLITDLDDTVWLGILGDDGIEGISWDLDHHSQLHAIYQQLLNALADSGVLIGVASNNDPALVQEALQRTDLVLNPKYLYPVEASRGPKSESVARILQAWNVGPESVVFIDDNALEVAEVGAAHPEIECILFPKQEPAALVEFFRGLRHRFGKRQIRDEDRERVTSLRRSEAFRETVHHGGSLDDVLRGAEGRIKFSYDKAQADGRALELVNKTNQFNLNGKRYTEASWSSFLSQENVWLQVAEYQDRFARLGKISVMAGSRAANRLTIHTWVMSCRAFSRRIEYHCLGELLSHLGATEIELDLVPTERNGPLRDFLKALAGSVSEGAVAITAQTFREKCPPLYHEKLQ